MQFAPDRFEDEVRRALREEAGVPDALIELAPPTADMPADLAFPTFHLARERGVAPPQLARELAGTLRFGVDSLVAGVAVIGPFLNFRVAPDHLATQVLEDLARWADQYGRDDLGAGRTILVEYSAPNVARRMHVGHLRSTIIGQAIANVLAALAFAVVRDNHLGDWGKNFGLLLTAIAREGRPTGSGEDALADLEQLNARYSALAHGDAAVDAEARSWSLRLEHGDPVARELWR